MPNSGGNGLALLRSFGLTDQSYILSGHSAGACLAFQAVLQPPRHYGLDYVPGAPSPACFDPAEIAGRVREGKAPRLIVLDQSAEDQLVPMNQRERFQANLTNVDGLRVVEGNRLTGTHDAPWEQGIMIWESLGDIFMLLQSGHC